MIFLLFLAGWLAAGGVMLAASVWLDPDKFDVQKRVEAHGSRYADLWTDLEQSGVAMRSVLTTVLWPAAIAYLVMTGLVHVLVRSKRERLRQREEAEKELAPARREVEDLLRSLDR